MKKTRICCMIISLVLLCSFVLNLSGCAANTQPINDTGETPLVETEPDTQYPIDSKPDTQYPIDSMIGKTLLKGWTGDFSEELYKKTINNYKKTCRNNPFDANIFSFESEVEVAEASVVYLSTVDDSDINNELKGYIDLYVPITCEDRTIKIDIGCLARGGAVKVLTPEGSMIPIAPDSSANEREQELDDKVWSYLVRVTGTDNINRYYYFRVDYSLRVVCYG